MTFDLVKHDALATSKFDFSGLFVLDLANNHQGSLDHGLRIVREHAEVVRTNGVKAAFKFQFRQLDDFIHSSHVDNSDNKHIGRFLSTRLTVDEFSRMTDEVRKQDLVTMCTPFDEASVDVIEKLGIEVIKIASCSAGDWPLIERITECGKPVVFSTGGLGVKEIDDLVSIFEHRRVDFAIMHCVSIYPTPGEKLHLNQIDRLRERYQGRVIGFSTHEDPDDLTPVQIAVAKGAHMLERHVGVESDEIKLNAYSATPVQIDAWMQAAIRALHFCGDVQRGPATREEKEAISSLQRGVYASQSLQKDTLVAEDSVYFAMPIADGQLSSGEWKSGIRLTEAVEEDGALMKTAISMPAPLEKQILFTSIHTIKGMLSEARIALATDFEAEFSHHYGIGRFNEVGATIIACINRSYCKKLIILLPGQRHPAHYHKQKEETFQVLHGVLEMAVERHRRTLHPGELQCVQQGVWHEFWSDAGVIFEEISTTHFNDDSFYEDKAINRQERSDRKTVVKHWGRYQI